jgi:3-(3-hydroxy-phenyl)propionate hydroxylase
MNRTVEQLPVGIVGAGPVGLITALGLVRYGVPVVIFEEDDRLSLDTKAGTILTRTLEVLHRYGVLTEVLGASLRIDEIGDIDRETNQRSKSVLTGALTEDTRFPFVINVPQHELERVLERSLQSKAPGTLNLRHKVTGFEQHAEVVTVEVECEGGVETHEVSYLLACDGGRSQVREQLGIAVQGETLPEKYMLVDLKVDLDVASPRDYPYLAYFGDPVEWMILVRQPHCWRFLFPLIDDGAVPSAAELGEKALRFIGKVDDVEILGSNVYTVHHRVAEHWREGRIFLVGDAAHLITPMWALGLNTGVLDASNLPWRLAWVRRGWADRSLLDGYETEQSPVATEGSGEMAQAARAYMSRTAGGVEAMGEGNWGNAFTRALLGVSLDVDGIGSWSMVRSGAVPDAVRSGDRAPDLPLFGARGIVHLHDLCADRFVALYFTDTRRRPPIPAEQSPTLAHFAVSRWDAPHDSGLRDRALFDPADRVRRRFGIVDDTLALLRPDGHVAALERLDLVDVETRAGELYERVTRRPPVVVPDTVPREQEHAQT